VGVAASACGLDVAVVERDAAGRDDDRGVATALAAPPAADPEPDADAAIQSTLDAVAAAFAAADPEALRPWLTDPASSFGQRWLARAANLAGVPLASYTLRLDDSLPDLATQRLRTGRDGGIQVRYVREEHAIAGFDPEGPSVEDLFLTLVEGEDGWTVAGDRDGEPLGLLSVDHLWDHGPVVATGDGAIVVLHHPGAAAIDDVIVQAERALEEARGRWPLAWPERVPVIVPTDQDELAELLHVNFDLSSFIAFATATPTGRLGDYELRGSRILLNPGPFLERTPETRQRILAHELIHVATRPVSGPQVPTWLEEGVAQAVGEQRATSGLEQLESALRRGDALTLPTDGQFSAGGEDRIFLSYDLSYSFVGFLVATYGVDAVADLYAAVGEASAGRPGTAAWQLDAAARDVLGSSMDELVEDWRDSL